MSCQMLYDKDKEIGCFFCNTTDYAFGPAMYADQDWLYAFANWLKDDPRSYEVTDLGTLWTKFKSALEEHQCPDCGTSLDKEGMCPGCGKEIIPL